MKRNREANGGPKRPPSNGYNRRFVFFSAGVASMGGFLFGYGTAVVSGALLFLEREFRFGPAMEGAVTAAVLLGALVGAIASGSLNDRFGRRVMLIVSAVVFASGSLIASFALRLLWLIVGRFIVGCAIGIASYTSPLYISETAPPRVRGGLVSLNQFSITVGIMAAYLVDFAYAYPGGWRWMFGLSVVPAAFLGMGMLFLPDTPDSLFSRGEEERAREALARIAAENLQAAGQARAPEKEKGTKVSWRELFEPPLRFPMAVGIGLAVFQQIVGINAVIYYAPTIFRHAGFGSAPVAVFATVGVGFVNVIVTLLAILLLDRLGRRPLLLAGTAGLSAALMALGLDFQGQWAERGTVAVVSLFAFIAFFAVSLGPIFWLMVSEIYPLRVRGRAMSVAAFSNWGANLLVAFTFPLLVSGTGESVPFWIYASMGVLAFFFSYFWAPETKGKSLREIEEHWTG